MRYVREADKLTSRTSRAICEAPLERSGAAAADWYYKAGLAYLEEGKREDALLCVERIRDLEAVLDLTVPNMFLADQLLRAVYPKN